MVIDIDADGLPESVKAFGIGGSDRWEVRRLRFEDADTPHTRPLLLVRVDDGVGGVTHFRYSPSSRFVPPPETAPRLPFVSWLVTGVRRTDGLCDLAPSDWFSLAGNPCLAAGHELVQRFEYEEGVYDGLAREFRGFARTRIFDGPAEIREPAGDRLLSDAGAEGKDRIGVGLRGRRRSAVADALRLAQRGRRGAHAGLSPGAAGRGARPLFAVRRSGRRRRSQCVVHRNSIFLANGEADPRTRIQSTCSMACAGAGESDALCDPAPPGKKQVDTTWAEPVNGAASPVWDRPAEIVTSHVDASGSLQTTALIRHVYDGLGSGQVDRGNLTAELARVSLAPEGWAFKLFGYDDGDPAGPGNITSVHVPVTGESRVPTTIEFDEEFALHPVRETASVSNAGASAERRIESRYDIRHGKRIESVGLHGRGAGDVAGSVYDGLGPPGLRVRTGDGLWDQLGLRRVGRVSLCLRRSDGDRPDRSALLGRDPATRAQGAAGLPRRPAASGTPSAASGSRRTSRTSSIHRFPAAGPRSRPSSSATSTTDRTAGSSVPSRPTSRSIVARPRAALADGGDPRRATS